MSAPVTDALNPGRRNGFRYRYVILATLTLCYTIQYLDRITTNILTPFISTDIGLSSAEIGLGSAIMMLFYGPSQWATGWLCDRIGSRTILLFSIVAWSLLTAGTAAIHGVAAWYVRMALFGLFVGTEFVPSARLLVRWFPRAQRATAQGILSWAWIVTPAWAPLVITALYVAIGDHWRPVFVILSIGGSVPLLLILGLIFDRPEKCRFAGQAEIREAYAEELEQRLITAADLEDCRLDHLASKVKSGNITFRQILQTKGFLPLVGVIIVAQQIIWGVLTWSAEYLVQVHHFAVRQMGIWACIYFVGGALGSLFGSWISDTFLDGRRKPMILIAFAGTLPFILLLANVRHGVDHWLLLLILTGAGFFSNMVWGPALAMPADLFPAEVYGKAMGFTNCCGYMFAAASPYAMGALIRQNAATGSVSYYGAWMFIAIAAVAGVIMALWLVDQGPRPGAGRLPH